MKQTGNRWTNAKGELVPTKYVRKYEKNDERAAHSLIRTAKSLAAKLSEFKQRAFAEAIRSYNVKLAEHGINGKEPKGNHTIFSFDGQLKIEIRISEGIYFDEVLIDEAQAKFSEFVMKNLKDDQADLGQLILGAFDKTDGRLDPKRILSLHRFKTSIKDKLFHEALDLVDGSTRVAGSKQYFRFWGKDTRGEYQPIILNFSAIN